MKEPVVFIFRPVADPAQVRVEVIAIFAGLAAVLFIGLVVLAIFNPRNVRSK